jgi:phosphoglycolate phosphatase
MAGVAIIWDLDGVLVDSLGLRIAGLADAASKAGVPLPNEADLRRWLCLGPRNALRQIPGVPTSLRPFEVFCRSTASQYLRTFTGIDEAIESLQRVGVKQALVTSRTSTDTNRWLDLCHVPNAFDVRITHSDGHRSKPNPDGLLAAAARLEIAVEDCAYVGDTIEDGTACERADMTFLLAGWGTPDAEEVLANVSANAVMNDPNDILNWVLEKRK